MVDGAQYEQRHRSAEVHLIFGADCPAVDVVGRYYEANHRSLLGDVAHFLHIEF
jgi:hypothetical protein